MVRKKRKKEPFFMPVGWRTPGHPVHAENRRAVVLKEVANSSRMLKSIDKELRPKLAAKAGKKVSAKALERAEKLANNFLEKRKEMLKAQGEYVKAYLEKGWSPDKMPPVSMQNDLVKAKTLISAIERYKKRN